MPVRTSWIRLAGGGVWALTRPSVASTVRSSRNTRLAPPPIPPERCLVLLAHDESGCRGGSTLDLRTGGPALGAGFQRRCADGRSCIMICARRMALGHVVKGLGTLSMDRVGLIGEPLLLQLTAPTHPVRLPLFCSGGPSRNLLDLEFWPGSTLT
ncbi:unnamed protein product [Pleuronectes platessa]|uniref:Uncharacterized protein n=1 Tax=Pleuronectes platessa TaxID=8262 RepID=A0A9N7UP40_PLEPL|nr:unnamed protein product [Pleuronectes platessa]